MHSAFSSTDNVTTQYLQTSVYCKSAAVSESAQLWFRYIKSLGPFFYPFSYAVSAALLDLLFSWSQSRYLCAFKLITSCTFQSLSHFLSLSQLFHPRRATYFSNQCCAPITTGRLRSVVFAIARLSVYSRSSLEKLYSEVAPLTATSVLPTRSFCTAEYTTTTCPIAERPGQLATSATKFQEHCKAIQHSSLVFHRERQCHESVK